MDVETVMFWGGLVGIWLAGSSLQKFIDSDSNSWKYLGSALFEGLTGIFLVLQGA